MIFVFNFSLIPFYDQKQFRIVANMNRWFTPLFNYPCVKEKHRFYVFCGFSWKGNGKTHFSQLIFCIGNEKPHLWINFKYYYIIISLNI